MRIFFREKQNKEWWKSKHEVQKVNLNTSILISTLTVHQLSQQIEHFLSESHSVSRCLLSCSRRLFEFWDFEGGCLFEGGRLFKVSAYFIRINTVRLRHTYHFSNHESLSARKSQRNWDWILSVMSCNHLHHSLHVFINEFHLSCQLIELLVSKGNNKLCIYSETRLIQIPRGHAEVSVLSVSIWEKTWALNLLGHTKLSVISGCLY